MAKPEDLHPGIWALAAVAVTKGLEWLGKLWERRTLKEDKTEEQKAREEIEERRDIRDVEKYLRERLEALETKYSALAERYVEAKGLNVILAAENESLKLQVGGLKEELSTVRDVAERQQRQINELMRRMPMDGQDHWGDEK